MGEPTKMRKASDEQKQYLLAYMEENTEFAHDRFESSDGAHIKATKWQMLSSYLNSIEGARKDVNQWRKYWRDQKLHAKERDILIKASFQRSGVNGLEKVKQLNPFEERIVALLSPPAMSGADVPELFILPQEQADMKPSLPVETPEYKVNLEALNVASEMGLTSISDEMPVTTVAAPPSAADTRPTHRKRKKAPSGKHTEVAFEEKILKIEEAKLIYTKKCYEIQEKSFIWRKEYEGKLLELREREISLQEKELEFKMKNIQ